MMPSHKSGAARPVYETGRILSRVRFVGGGHSYESSIDKLGRSEDTPQEPRGGKALPVESRAVTIRPFR